MAALYDRVGMTTATTGTGTLTLGSAITDATNGDYLTFADAGVPNATVVNYLIVNGNNFELGTGTYTVSGTTLTRGATLSKSGGTKGTTAITLAGSSNVYIVPQAATANQWSAQQWAKLSDSWTAPSLAVGSVGTSGLSYFGGLNIISTGASVLNLGSGVTMPNATRLGWSISSDNTGSVPYVSLAANGTTAGYLKLTDNTNTVGTGQFSTGGLLVSRKAKTAAYTLLGTDFFVSGDATGGAFSLTLPTAVGCEGEMFTLKKIDSSGNAVTVATTSSQTIDGAASYSLASQWSTVTVISNNANWLIVSKV